MHDDGRAFGAAVNAGVGYDSALDRDQLGWRTHAFYVAKLAMVMRERAASAAADQSSR
jgi:hypothetical protein